jgi:CO/xanthine dehydrogenase Mo-binding subunit
MWYGCGNTSLSNPSTMHVGIAADGTVTLYSGAQDIGQGTNTTMMQVAADGLGIRMDQDGARLGRYRQDGRCG